MRGKGLAATVIAALCAVSCKSNSDSEGGVQSTKTVEEPEQSARGGGHIVLPSNEPRFLNPILETRFNRANMLIFEGLVGFDAKLEPIPRLAESWTRSPDGKRITFVLREAKWSDGTPFTSADVAFTIDRIQNTKAPTVWKAYFGGLKTLETPDDRTVIATYERPYAPALVSFSVGILPAHRYPDGDLIGADANQDPVGTGPFKLTRWEAGTRMILGANELHWNGRPELDSVELAFHVADPLVALTEGRIDFASIPDIGAWSTEAQMPEFRARFESTTTLESLFRLIAWNTRRAPFDDPRIRRALTMALNRQRVTEDVFLGQAKLLSAPFFPNMIGADPSIAPWPYDLDRAVKLLDEAGKPSRNGERFDIELVTLDSQRNPANEEMFAIFRRDLRAIGIDLSVEYLGAADFEERLVAGKFDAAFFGWLRDIPDPDPTALLHSAQVRGGQNFAGYERPEVDALLESAVQTSNREERKALYMKLHAILHEDLPYTVIYAPLSHYAWSRRLRGVNPADIGPQTRFPGIGSWSVVPTATPPRAP